jgi:hypothetical protein
MQVLSHLFCNVLVTVERFILDAPQTERFADRAPETQHFCRLCSAVGAFCQIMLK